VESIKEIISIASPIIMAIATIFLALFTWRTWKISNEQHKLYHDPDLNAHPLVQPEAGETPFSFESLNEADLIIDYSIVLVNPGRVPIVITHIEERLLLSDGVEFEIVMNFRTPPSENLTNVYMSNLPGVIGSGDLLICRKYFSLAKANIQEEIKLLITEFMAIEINYSVGERMKSVRQRVPLHLRIPGKFKTYTRN
jgi:hypothetical protein